MDVEILKLKKAMFVMWSWNFNPEILTQDDLDWFYGYILESHVTERNNKKAQENKPAQKGTDSAK
jgi:hypothetical protein